MGHHRHSAVHSCVPVILTARILSFPYRGYPLSRQAHFCQVPFADVVIITTLLSSLSLIRAGLYHFSFIFTPVTVTHTYACDKQLKSAHQFDVVVQRVVLRNLDEKLVCVCVYCCSYEQIQILQNGKAGCNHTDSIRWERAKLKLSPMLSIGASIHPSIL